MKAQELKESLKKMNIGEPVYFPTAKSDSYMEVDRVFVGIKVAWAIRYQNEEIVLDLDEAAEYIAKHWNQNLKKVIDQQFSELDEIEDLGEY
ncbi:hypothetical protein [Hazenella coriacea]|uniref:Uncharacterized protein n=1 Tax=Hazenella coriacea TaxID=1179467 RepID=A0A4R3LBJ4_9BACL|nr:hypothetical protein [Hazenella coriacea]TCS94886.1 hypothetical protein EDD58_103309 [Hazenella coriacea]